MSRIQPYPKFSSDPAEISRSFFLFAAAKNVLLKELRTLEEEHSKLSERIDTVKAAYGLAVRGIDGVTGCKTELPPDLLARPGASVDDPHGNLRAVMEKLDSEWSFASAGGSINELSDVELSDVQALAATPAPDQPERVEPALPKGVPSQSVMPRFGQFNVPADTRLCA